MDSMRLAVSTPRSLGRAVARNRARRRVREAFRLAIGEAADCPGQDLVLVLRTPAAKASYEAVREAVAAAMAALRRS
jgi:ribonuclease P protein component